MADSRNDGHDRSTFQETVLYGIPGVVEKIVDASLY